MLYKEKSEHKVVDTGFVTYEYQDEEIRKRYPGWKRCMNVRHKLKYSADTKVCLKECK
jgi:hypothetical protein